MQGKGDVESGVKEDEENKFFMLSNLNKERKKYQGTFILNLPNKQMLSGM